MGPIQSFIYKAEIFQLRLVYLARTHSLYLRVIFLLSLLILQSFFVLMFLNDKWIEFFASYGQEIGSVIVLYSMITFIFGLKLGKMMRKIEVNESMRLK